MKMFTLFSEKEERRKIGKNKEEKEWKEQATDVAVMDNNIVTFLYYISIDGGALNYATRWLCLYYNKLNRKLNVETGD